MKFSEQWLREWVNPEVDSAGLAEQLTMAGLEVDGVEPAAGEFAEVVVARIEAVEQHPDADKLRVCQVNDGSDEMHQVVCGAPNAAVGLVAPFARIGAKLPGGMKIRRAKLRGVESFGMLCSARELGMGEEHDGLLPLPEDLVPGMDIVGALGLDDQIIDVDLTPNRADCLSVRGISRDIAAVNGIDVTAVEVNAVAATHDETYSVKLACDDDCPRYAGRVIKGVDAARPTPLWMTERLRRAGIRPVSAIVDCTQYVMLELGQPMHAYDLAKLNGEIVVRRAQQGETCELLDGSTPALNERIVAITDASGVIGLGGIMGGASTGVSDATTDILLEAAYFSPAAILGRARDLGMHTDASHRFERGVDPTRQDEAIERITGLIVSICGGEPGPTEITTNDHLQTAVLRSEVRLRHDRLCKVVGCEIPVEDVEGILRRLEMNAAFSDGAWTVTAPTHRFDIAIEEDLIEEVARIWGYNRVPNSIPEGHFVMDPVSESRVTMNRLRDTLVANDWQEAVTWSFVSDAALQRFGLRAGGIELANPLSEDLAIMRTSLLPGLIEAVRHNRNRQQGRIRLFETGVCFSQPDAADGSPINETQTLALAALGSSQPEQWGDDGRAMDFFDLKGQVELLLALNGKTKEFSVSTTEKDWLHPGRSACVQDGDRVFGHFGALHPRLQRELDLEETLWVAEINLAEVLNRDVPKFEELSKFPSIRRDLAFFVAENVTAGMVRDCIESAAGELLKEVLIFDVYQGQGVPEGQRSVAAGLILQDASRTLTDSDANTVEERVIVRLKEEVSATLRGDT